MCEKSCFNCARRKGFICFGLYYLIDTETRKHYGVDMQKHIEGTSVKIDTEEDLKKVGHVCNMFKVKAWSVS